MPKEITDANFASEVQNNPGLVLADFWAPWCGPCRILGPIVEDVAASVTDVSVGKVNVDENPLISDKFGIRSIPTVILFKNGQPVEQMIGVRPKDDILAMINKHR